MVDDNDSDEASPENDGKVSSSTQRMRLLGHELKEPYRIWDRKSAPYLIGLTGGSCSGKTNISKYLGILLTNKIGTYIVCLIFLVFSRLMYLACVFILVINRDAWSWNCEL